MSASNDAARVAVSSFGHSGLFRHSSFVLRHFLHIGELVLQPPLPLQEFLPLQPLSPLLQPPRPLHEFFPAQSCLADPLQPFGPVQLALSLSICNADFPAILPKVAVARAWVASDPVKRPAIAAPVIIALEDFFMADLVRHKGPGMEPGPSRKRYRLPGLLAAVGGATALAFAGILAFATVVAGFTAAVAFAGVLSLAGMLVNGGIHLVDGGAGPCACVCCLDTRCRAGEKAGHCRACDHCFRGDFHTVLSFWLLWIGPH
jgi:hypothetical protein